MYLLGTPGWAELVLIAFIVLLLFGKNRLPDLAKSMGTGIREFRKGISGQFDHDEEKEEEAAPVQAKKTKAVKSAESKAPQAQKSKSKTRQS